VLLKYNWEHLVQISSSLKVSIKFDQISFEFNT
jgi:hypothetical protein